MAYKKNKKNDQTLLEVLVVGIFRGLWWLVKLPFGKKRKVNITISDRQGILKRRLELESNLASNDLFVLKQTVMDADKLVDYTLKLYGFMGETFADRLRNAEKIIDPYVYDLIWKGHKVRNKIAHEHNLNLSPDELKQAVNNLLEYIKHV